MNKDIYSEDAPGELNSISSKRLQSDRAVSGDVDRTGSGRIRRAVYGYGNGQRPAEIRHDKHGRINAG